MIAQPIILGNRSKLFEKCYANNYRGQELGDENIKYLPENNKRLTDLNLGSNKLTDEIMLSLLNHPCLTAVDLSYNRKISNITAVQIVKQENLQG